MFDPREPMPDWLIDPPTPVEVRLARRKRWRRFILALVLLLGVWLIYRRYVARVPVDYPEIADHFKYGSVGTEAGNGIPYRIWKVLPEMFPEHLPDRGGEGYGAFGFLNEPGRETPVGFSVRRSTGGVELISPNCAACHTSTVRVAEGGPPRLILGMPAHTLDLLGYFRFLFDCADDPRFTADNLMAAIEAGDGLDPIERIAYRNVAIPRTREQLLVLRARSDVLLEHPSGTGRIDTFTPYKILQFNYRDLGLLKPGNVDLPSIWNQRPREGMWLHWDGNNDSVHERNLSASMGAGATPDSVDLPRLARIEEWLLDLEPPRFPSEYPLDLPLAFRGADVYRRRCVDCHGLPGKFRMGRVGTVIPIEEIGTDPARLDSYTHEFASNQYTLGAGRPWRFTRFRKTGGYAAMPLDGLWLRAPYLHNGSVPTLRDLLEPPDRRPTAFYRGNDLFDPVDVGFVHDLAEADVPTLGGGVVHRRFERFDTTQFGDGNGGHAFGADLPDEDKDALLEYLKTF